MTKEAIQRIEENIGQVALGDRAAFVELYNATSGKLFGVTLRVLGNRAEAEDALQEIYIKIWGTAGRYQVNGLSPMTWLITIARNHAIDKLRARRGGHDTIDEVFDLADPARGPEQLAIDQSENARLEGCLGQLEQDRASAVRGAYLSGYTYAELATQHSVPLNTMRTWLRRSLQKLKACLSHD